MKKEIIVPAAGESVTEADIAEWLKADGDYVELDDALVELETDKASMPLNAEVAGILSISVEEGTVHVGDVIGFITPGDAPAKSDDAPAADAAPAPTPTPSAAPAQPAPASSSYASGHPSPAAATILANKGVDPASVQGSGKDGRVTKQDAIQASAAPKAAPAASDTSSAADTSSAPVGERVVREEKLSRIRRTIANRMIDAQQSSAMLTTFNEVDMSEVMALRSRYKEAFKDKYEVGLGFMSFFTKACSLALAEYPVVNAQMSDTHVTYHDYCDIGIAVATPKGLVVPVVRDAQTLSFSGIERTILGLAMKGRDGKLTPDDMSGGTFTITNGGVFGSMLSTPILNRPQSAILGMHNIVKRPVVVGDEIKIRPIMYVALTYDHRLIDGSDAVRFLVKVKEYIEDPTRLLIEV